MLLSAVELFDLLFWRTCVLREMVLPIWQGTGAFCPLGYPGTNGSRGVGPLYLSLYYRSVSCCFFIIIISYLLLLLPRCICWLMCRARYLFFMPLFYRMVPVMCFSSLRAYSQLPRICGALQNECKHGDSIPNYFILLYSYMSFTCFNEEHIYFPYWRDYKVSVHCGMRRTTPTATACFNVFYRWLFTWYS